MGMSVLYLLIPVSLVFASAFLGVFFWAVCSGQFEDTCTPSMRLLADDPTPPSQSAKPAARPAGKTISHDQD